MAKLITSEAYPIGSILGWLTRNDVSIYTFSDSATFTGWTKGGGLQWDPDTDQDIRVIVPAGEIWTIYAEVVLQLQSDGSGSTSEGNFCIYHDNGSTIYRQASNDIDASTNQCDSFILSMVRQLTAGEHWLGVEWNKVGSGGHVSIGIPNETWVPGDTSLKFTYGMTDTEIASMYVKLINKVEA